MRRKWEIISCGLGVIAFAAILVGWISVLADLVARYFSEMMWLAW